MYCEVRLLDAPYALDRPFDYSCPDPSVSGLHVGSLVRVPFGAANKTRAGVVTALKSTTDSEKVKPVHEVLDDRFSLDEELCGLCLFLKEHTLCTFGEAARTVLPPGALSPRPNIRYRKTYRLTLSQEECRELLAATGRAGVRSEGQRAVLTYLMQIGSADEALVRALPTVESAHIQALIKKGYLAFSEEESVRNPYAAYAGRRDETPIVLSDAQSRAYATVEELLVAPEARAGLLYGVTGSGKTSVIIKAIDKTLGMKKSVILLVPEIALTPQTVSIFCRRYGERVAVIHSSLSQGERCDAWRRIREGLVDLVIGTRSAVFAPLSNLGLIVIDEEHEHTYKSESDPKYHTRDVAAYRCGKSGALMLLSSATPSIESFYKAQRGVYTLIPLRERYGGARLPDAVIVDMREERRLGNTSPISQRLLNELAGADAREEQAILFLNRRGYNSQIGCRACGEVIACPRCSVSLTYHTARGGGKLLCHLCGFTAPAPKACTACGSEELSYLGFGTQRVEGDLEKYLPEARVMRMDADTTGEKLAYDRMLEEFREGGADILLGTQMVTKGHDFPRVSLVGVVLADTSLYVSDFRAAERTFSLLTQVIGRAGRARTKGVAVIQTYSPMNDVIRLACEQDYDRFYEGEIALRRELAYPPFCDMAQLTLISEDEGRLFSASAALTERIRTRIESAYSDLPFTVYGPFEAQVYRVNEKYRLRIVIKCKLNGKTRALFRELLDEFSVMRDVTLTVDLNPLSV